MTTWIRQHVWLLFLLIGIVLSGLYSSVAETAQYFLYYAVAIAAVAALGAGLFLHRIKYRLPWLILTGAIVLSLLADMVWDSYWVVFALDAPNPSIADPLYLAGFGMAIAAFLLWSRRVNAEHDRETGVDAAIVALGCGVIAWIFVIEPRIYEPGISLVGQATSLSYPILDLFLLAVLIRLLLRPGGHHQRALLLVVAGTLSIVAADGLYGWGELTENYQAFEIIANSGYMLWYVFWGAAALDPTITELDREAGRNPKPAGGLTGRRFTLLTGAALAAPASLVVEQLSQGSLGALVVATASATLFALVIYRMRLMVRSLETALSRQATLQQELQHTAFHDTLTGLANRANVDRRLDNLLDRDRQANLAILFLDLDNFKEINDRFGHASGDQLLTTVAGRLRGCVRTNDTVSRLGGDEFLILLELDAESPYETGVATAERILTAMQEPIEIGNQPVTVGASIGIAWPAGNDLSKDHLLVAADRAMYTAKRTGKNRYGVAPAPQASSEPLRPDAGVPQAPAPRVTLPGYSIQQPA
jgi:diguanylate cyclase (GGDEF)-like protein